MKEHAGVRPPRALDAAGLSRREAEVLSYVARGLTNEAVGSLLGISPRTVRRGTSSGSSTSWASRRARRP